MMLGHNSYLRTHNSSSSNSSNVYQTTLEATGAVWYGSLSNTFQFLNNIARIFMHFFTHTYFQKIQTTLLEQRY